MQGSPKITHSPISPSFNSYSSEKLAEIAARVVQEIANDPQPLPDDSDHPTIFSWNVEEDQLDRHFQSLNVDDDRNDAEEEQNDDDDFEFAVVWKEADSSSTSVADEIFYNGQIRPVCPLFNTALLSNQEQEELSISHVLTASKETTTTTPKKSTRSPLGKLFDEDRGEATTSCSSSEADELDGVSPATYCVWAPGKATEDNQRQQQQHDSSAEGQRCKKSHSTGSSKRWKLRDLVFRSHSDGKETFVFLAPSSKKSVTLSGGYAKKAQEVKGSVSVQDLINNNYIRGVRKFGDKRRSFLPYRQDLVGIFSNNVHGLNKNLHPF